MKRFKVFDQVRFFLLIQVQVHYAVVMIDNVEQRGESAVVIGAALDVRPHASMGRRSIPMVGRTIGLVAVDADLGRRMHVPTRVGPKRLDVAGIAVGLA